MTKEEFVTEVLDGISPPPQYFAKNAKMNQSGYSDLEQVLSNGDTPLSAEAFEQLAKIRRSTYFRCANPTRLYKKSHSRVYFYWA